MLTSLDLAPDLTNKDEESATPQPQCLLFLISGNPGIIEYYEPFLKKLKDLLSSSPIQNKTLFHLAGRDLAGFNDDDHEPFTTDRPPFDLEHQITHTLSQLAAMRITCGQNTGRPFDQVILIGHSVGAYIALEIFHRLLQKPDQAPHLRLKAGILLFPTITHLAQSPSGIHLEFIRRSPLLNNHAHRVATGFLGLSPSPALRWFVRHALGFSPHATAITVRWLMSRDGVWQAIHLGKDEMRVVGEERWSDELWEVAEDAEVQEQKSGDVDHNTPPPKFFFYFGQKDHWVSNKMRDEFIAKRKSHADREGPSHKKGRTKVEMAESNIPHAFCTSESSYSHYGVHELLTASRC